MHASEHLNLIPDLYNESAQWILCLLATWQLYILSPLQQKVCVSLPVHNIVIWTEKTAVHGCLLIYTHPLKKAHVVGVLSSRSVQQVRGEDLAICTTKRENPIISTTRKTRIRHLYNKEGEDLSSVQQERGGSVICTTRKGRIRHLYNKKGENPSSVQQERGGSVICTTRKGRIRHLYNKKGEDPSSVQQERRESVICTTRKGRIHHLYNKKGEDLSSVQ